MRRRERLALALSADLREVLRLVDEAAQALERHGIDDDDLREAKAELEAARRLLRGGND